MLTPPPSQAEHLPETASRPRYHAGTLVYTLPGLASLMFWLLWGDFCYNLMEGVFPSVLPLKLKELAAPNWLIAVFMTTIPNALNATVCPAVSYWSDRHRGRLGRRIPFILHTIPFLCLFLILIGAAPHFAEWMEWSGWGADARLSSLVLIGVFATGFAFFNMFVSSVYYYLFNDVVPPQFLGRFLAAFRFVGVIANGLFFLFIFPMGETHFTEIFIWAAVLYGIVFLAMCLKVKEGTYSPPSPLRDGTSVFAGIRTFFVESFSSRYYWCFYLAVAFWAVSLTSGVFTVFFARSLGITLEQYGWFVGGSSVFSAVLLIPCGILSDRFHPLRTLLTAAGILSGLAALPLVFLLFSPPPESVFWVWCAAFGLSVPFSALFVASELPTYMQVLPRDRFGQFCASTALVRSIASLAAGLVCGALLDSLKEVLPRPDDAYRYLPLWSMIFQALSAIFLGLLYREWKKNVDHGPLARSGRP